MANICSNYITITGNQTQLRTLANLIYTQDNHLSEKGYHHLIAGYYGLLANPKTEADIEKTNEVLTSVQCLGFSYDGEEIYLDITSKWVPPMDDMYKLIEEFPDLIINGHSEEPGNRAYSEFTISKEGQVEQQLEELDYLEKHGPEDFKEELNDIRNMPYEEFLKEYSSDEGYEDGPNDEYLDMEILKRIKPKDLPLFIHRRWLDDAHEEYQKRVKELS